MSLIVARRYARALYEDAAEKGAIEKVDDDIAMIQESVEGSPELRRFFTDRMVNAQKKEAVIDSLFKKRVHSITLSFLQLLTRKRRENLFLNIVEAYQDLRNKQLGVVEAHVRVALPMSAEEEKKVKEGIESLTGKHVQLKTEIDPSIMGGVIIRVGDMVYDGSVQHQLNSLKDRLKLSTFLAN